jgi:EmrB/QacA subfamily drug resistance transporter
MPAYPWLVVAIICIGAFIGQLDASIVQLALPELERTFHSTLASVSWVAIGYLLGYAATLPVFARISEMYGRKVIYITGYALFTAASVFSGAASSLEVLIASRLLQGIGGGMLGSNSLSILAKAVRPDQRGRAMGFVAACQAVGISAGPVLGGVLLDSVGWRWVFWVSIPFCVAALVLGWLVLPQTSLSPAGKQFDRWGAMLLSPALAAFVISLSELGTWRPEAVLLTMFLTVILLPPFLWKERSRESPLVDLQLFRIAPFLGGIIGVSACYALLYAMFFVMSFAFVRGLNESPTSAGLHLAIIPIFIGIVAPISGRMYERFGSRILTTTGMALCSAAIVVLAYSTDGMYRGVAGAGALALFGIGLGIYISPNNAATMEAAPEGQNVQAGGLLNLMRVLGCMGGISIASSTLTWRLHADTGFAKRTLEVSTDEVLIAAHQVLWTLLLFSILAGGASLVRNKAASRS